MPRIKEVLSLMRAFAPECDTEPGFDDNVGLLIGSEDCDTDTAVLCLDCTEKVIEEADSSGARLVISHHPAIFYGLKRVTDADPTGRMLLAAARKGISVYSAHTNLDFCDGGINDYVAALAGLTSTEPMELDGGVKVGRIGSIRERSVSDWAAELSETFGDRHITVIGDGAKRVRRVAVVNGGGGNMRFVSRAVESGADCYVTADVPHHVRLYAAESGLPLIIMQHYCMEAIYMGKLTALLENAAKKQGLAVRFIRSATERNPASSEVL